MAWLAQDIYLNIVKIFDLNLIGSLSSYTQIELSCNVVTTKSQLIQGGAKEFGTRFNVGHETFENLSDICQKSVRKLSVTKMCQNSVRKLSDANICQNSIRIYLETHQKCVVFYTCVRKLSVLNLENCLKSVRIITFDTFLTHLP